MSPTESRPTAVSAAFWALIVGAVLLMAGGLMAATVNFDALRQSHPATVSDQTLRNLLRLNRGVGVLFAVGAAALAWMAARARDHDPRFRRATMALALTIVVLVAVASVYVGSILSMISLVPIVVGTLLLNRPSVVEWFTSE